MWALTALHWYDSPDNLIILYCAVYFSGSETFRADICFPDSSVIINSDRLNVSVPLSSGMSVRMGNIVSWNLSFSADFTFSRHLRWPPLFVIQISHVLHYITGSYDNTSIIFLKSVNIFINDHFSSVWLDLIRYSITVPVRSVSVLLLIVTERMSHFSWSSAILDVYSGAIWGSILSFFPVYFLYAFLNSEVNSDVSTELSSIQQGYENDFLYLKPESPESVFSASSISMSRIACILQ